MENLRQLEYHFDSELRLRHVETGDPFKFVNQAHYEELADAVAEYIQDVMVKEYGMIQIDLPIQEHRDKVVKVHGEKIAELLRSPIFVSSNYKEVDTVLILLCGTGRVSAGQWARRLCINESLKTGSVLPFLDWAKEQLFGVIVLNPNKTSVRVEEECYSIPYNESAEDHVEYVWQFISKDLPVKHYILVAHSYGGIGTLNLLKKHGEEVLQRLRCIAFTDALLPRRSFQKLSKNVKCFLLHSAINWQSSDEELDTVIEDAEENDSVCKVVSAGTNVHESTTMNAFPSICKFLLNSLH